jgi:hypothetical protein
MSTPTPNAHSNSVPRIRPSLASAGWSVTANPPGRARGRRTDKWPDSRAPSRRRPLRREHRPRAARGASPRQAPPHRLHQGLRKDGQRQKVERSFGCPTRARTSSYGSRFYPGERGDDNRYTATELTVAPSSHGGLSRPVAKEFDRLIARAIPQQQPPIGIFDRQLPRVGIDRSGDATSSPASTAIDGDRVHVGENQVAP